MANPGAFDAGSVEVRLGADFEQAGFDKYDRALEAARRHKAIKAELGADVDTAAFDAYERKLAEAEGRAKRRKAFKAALGADYDSRAFHEFERAMDKARRERDVKKTLKIDVDQGGFGGWIRNLRTARGEADGFSGDVRRLGLTLRGIGWGALAASIGPLIAGLGALAAAAVEAVAGLAPLGGVLATLPQFAAAAGQGLGVLALAGTGVIQTLKAMQAVDKGAAQASQSNASARRSAAASITSAQRSVADATRGVHDAQLQLTDAERQAKFARQDLTKAEKDAGEQLKQLKFQAQDAALAEAGASLTLAEARDHLRQVQEDPNATAFDVADARQQLTEAKQARTEAIDQSKQTQKAFDEAKRKGKSQLPDVVNARRQYQAAERSVQQAVAGVAQAETQQRRATQDLAKARTAATASTQKQTAAQSEYQRQLKQLDPAARAFVLRLKELQGTGLSLTHAAQSGFFPGALKGLNSALPLLGRARTAIHDTAGVMGNLVAQAGKFLGSKAFGRDFTQITKENAVLIDRAGQAGGHLFKALVNLTIAAQPLTDWISKLVLGWSKSIDKMTEVGRKNGDLQKFFAETKHVLQDVFSIVGDLGGALVGVFKAAYPFGKQMLDGLTKSAGKLNDLVNSAKGQNALHDFFKNAQAPLHELWLGLGDLAKAIGSLFTKKLFDAMATILHALRVDVIPALASIAKTLGETVVPAAAKAIGAVAKLLKDLAPGLKPILTALGNLIDVFTGVVKFVDKLTQDLPGVLKLLPALGLAGVSWLGWKTLLGFIATTKTRLLEIIGLERVANTQAPGPGLPSGRPGGPGALPLPVPGTRVPGLPAPAQAGRLERFGQQFLNLGKGTQIGLAAAASYFGTQLELQIGSAFRKATGSRTKGTILGGLFAGPIGAIGGSGAADFAVSRQDAALKNFADRVKKVAPELVKLRNSRGLSELAREADQLGNKFPKLADKFHAAGDALRKEAAAVSSGVIGKLRTSVEGVRFHTEKGIFGQLQTAFTGLSDKGRQAGASSMIALARSLEREGRLPKGATTRLIHDIERQYPQLVPFLHDVGLSSMKAIETQIKDQRVVKAVRGQIDTISKTWDDAPKLAHTTAFNVRRNWQTEMDFLKKKMHEGTAEQRAVAKAQWDKLKGDADGAGKAVNHAWERRLGGTITEFGDAMSTVAAATQVGYQNVQDMTNAALKGLGAKPINFRIKAINVLKSIKIPKFEGGGWIGRPGDRGQDEIPMLADPGDAILNGQQQDILNLGFARLGLGPMFARGGRLARFVSRATGGRIPVVAGAGEFHATPDMFPMLDMASQAAIGGGLDELFGQYNTPHWAYSRGGPTRRAAGGYVYPMGSGLHLGRTDMGVDFSGSGNIATIGDAYFTRVASQHSGTGWPGAGDGGTGNNGAMMVYRLKNGPRAGRYVYLAENVDPLRGMHSGVTLPAGTAYAHARGQFPFLEIGWAADGHGTTLSVAHGTQNSHPNHSNTPEGLDFLTFLQGLAHGKIKGGLGGAVAAVWKAIKAPTVLGPGGALKDVAQAGINLVTGAANRKGRQVAASTTSAPGAVGPAPQVKGTWSLANLARLWTSQGGDPRYANLMAHVAMAESTGNPNAHNPSGASGLWQILGQVVSGNIYDPVVNARNAIKKFRDAGSHPLAPWYASRAGWGRFAGGLRVATGGYVNPIRGARARRGQIDAGVDYTGSGPLSAIGNAVVRLVRPYGSSSHWTDPSGHKGGFVRYQLSDGPRQGNHVYYAEHLDPLVRQGQRVSPGQRVAHFGAKHGDSNIEIGWAAKHGEGSLALASGQGVGHTTGAGWNFNQFIKALGASPTGFVMSGGIHGSTRVGGRGVTRGSSPGSPGGKGSTGPVSASGKHSYVDPNFVTWRYPTQAELNEWYGKPKTAAQKGSKKSGPRGSSHHRGTHSIWPAGAYSGLAAAHGVKGHRATIAGAVAMAETAPHGFFASVGDGGQSHGPWQVYHPAHPQYSVSRLMNEPDYTANAMAQISGHGSNWAPWTTYRTGAYRHWLSAAAHHIPWKARGGFLGRAARFAKGGWVSSSSGTGTGQGTGSFTVDPTTGRATSGGGRRAPINQANIPIPNMGSAETHWGKGIKHWTDEAAKLERKFSRRERVITREDSRLEYVISPADGSPAHVNQGAIDQRTKHLNELIDLKQRITHAYWKLRQAIEYLRKAYRQTIAKLRKQLSVITSKLRRTAVKSQIKQYEDRLATLNEDWQTADDSWWSAGQDKIDLIQERDVLLPDAQQQVSDSAGGVSEDQQAILDQAKQRIAVLEEATRIQEGTIAAFRSPGDIGIGAPNAYAAAFDLPGVGQGNVWGGAAAPYGASAYAGGPGGVPAGVPQIAGGQMLGGLTPGVPYIVKVLPIDDPQGQQQLAGAVNAGNGYQSPRPSPLEVPGI